MFIVFRFYLKTVGYRGYLRVCYHLEGYKVATVEFVVKWAREGLKMGGRQGPKPCRSFHKYIFLRSVIIYGGR